MGKLQNEDFKTEAQLTGAGGAASQLLNDSKIYVTALSLNKTLDDAITAGDFAAPVFVGAKYTATTLTNPIPNTSAPTIFDCPTSVYDSHSAVTTGASWVFTVPTAQSGKYRLTSIITTDTYAWSVNNYLIMIAYKNSVANSVMQWWIAQEAASLQMSVGGSAVVDCVAGDTLDIRFWSSRAAGSITGVEAAAYANQISIEKIG